MPTHVYPFEHRLRQLQDTIGEGEVWLIATATDIHYLTGFVSLVPEERESFLMLTKTVAWLTFASFSPAPPHTSGLQTFYGVSPTALVQYLHKLQEQTSWHSLRVDLQSLTAIEYQHLQKANWTPLSLDKKALWQQRLIKDSGELAWIERASSIAAEVITQLRTELRVGMTEHQVSRRLEVLLLEHGSDKTAFPTIVAFGPHGALPHHQPTNTQLEENTAILIDFGASVAGYRSDMTRSWWFGKEIPAEFTKIEAVVLQAYRASLTNLNGAHPTAASTDTAARSLIAAAGYSKEYIHTTGHGVGLDIHEPPSLYHTSHQALESGMVITIEPGIYLEGKFGYRYENTVTLTQAGARELTLEKNETGVK